jgi:hypothetical protein
MNRVLLALAACALLAAALVPSAQAAQRGRIKLTVTLQGQPFNDPSMEYCAVRPKRAKKYGVNEKSIVGTCGHTNTKGVVTIKRVPAGRWGVAVVGGVGSCAYPKCGSYHKVKVRRGKTTARTWDMPMWG